MQTALKNRENDYRIVVGAVIQIKTKPKPTGKRRKMAYVTAMILVVVIVWMINDR